MEYNEALVSWQIYKYTIIILNVNRQNVPNYKTGFRLDKKENRKMCLFSFYEKDLMGKDTPYKY